MEGLERLTTNILAESYRPSGGVGHQEMVFMQAVNTRESVLPEGDCTRGVLGLPLNQEWDTADD